MDRRRGNEGKSNLNGDLNVVSSSSNDIKSPVTSVCEIRLNDTITPLKIY